MKMTKVEAVKEFKEIHGSMIKTETKTTVRCVWNEFVDNLHQDGRISEYQAYNWVQPAFCK